MPTSVGCQVEIRGNESRSLNLYRKLFRTLNKLLSPNLLTHDYASTSRLQSRLIPPARRCLMEHSNTGSWFMPFPWGSKRFEHRHAASRMELANQPNSHTRFPKV